MREKLPHLAKPSGLAVRDAAVSIRYSPALPELLQRHQWQCTAGCGQTYSEQLLI